MLTERNLESEMKAAIYKFEELEKDTGYNDRYDRMLFLAEKIALALAAIYDELEQVEYQLERVGTNVFTPR